MKSQFKHYKQRNVQPGGRQGALISAWVDLAMREHKFLNVKRMLIVILILQTINTGLAAYAYFPEQIKFGLAWTGAKAIWLYSTCVNGFVSLF